LSPAKILSFFLFILHSLLPAPLSAETEGLDALLREGNRHLEAWRLSEAEAVVSRLLDGQPKSLKVLDFKTRVDFYQGRYAEALKTVNEAMAIQSANEERLALRLLVQWTHDTVKPLKSHESEHFILLVNQDRDGILASLALATLEKSYQSIGKELGFFPEEKVRVEIAPDMHSFNAISTLSLRDIEETGAVGICKFNKIMTISPRTLVHGYRWLDILSHEYLHFAIVGLSNNKAPIWLHEGIARYYEAFWRQKDERKERIDYLTPASQTLLAQALEKNQLISFEKMEPSLINLETPQDVQLAYAEAASAIDFIANRRGPAGVRHLLSEMGEASASKAIEKVLGVSFAQFQNRWKEFLRAKGLKEVEGSRVRKLKVVKDDKEDGEETIELKEIQSVVARNRTHLGDRLWGRNRKIASAAEYRRALKASPHSIIILNRLGEVLLEHGKHAEALPHLNKAQTLDPDYVTTYVKLGRLHHAKKNFPLAKTALEQAIQINPFNPLVHRLMFDIHTALGDSSRAKESKALLDKLNRQR
jgi:tetratricopeptide (TPR) repeat protein